MKKSLLIVLLVVFAFTVWSVYAFSKATKTQPTQVQKTEENIEPQFPKVAPPPIEIWEPVRRGTQEDFQRVVQSHKGRTPAEIQQMQEQPAEVPVGIGATEAMPVYCIVGNQHLPCCYYQPAGVSYLACWGQIRYMTLLDIDDNGVGVTPACAFPYYPFDVDTITTTLYAGDVCSLWVKARVYRSDMDPTCPWVVATVGTSDSFWVQHPGGFLTIKVPISTANACVYGKFFGMFYIKNTDDFVDPVNCPTAPFQFGLSWLFDASGRECQSYWGSLTYTNGYLYDVVTNAIASGAVRIRAIGHTATDNLCAPPVDEWYYKPALPAAPAGVPDFDQGQFPPAFCGPVAGADILWWQFANEGLTMPPDPMTLTNEIAAAAGTVPGIGTACDALGIALLQVVQAHGGWWFTETTVYAPDFVYVQKELRRCQTLTLLLGFWQEDPPTVWTRFGGHFVALSGIDIFAPTYQFAFSDPAQDAAEFCGPGVVKHPVDPWPHIGDPLVHNNPANASFDWYPVSWPSPSPGGYLYLSTYVPYKVIDTTICDTIPPKNHFKAWKTIPQTFDTTVFVRDQFMEDSLRLLGIEFISNPVLKITPVDTSDIIKPDDHLTWYRAEGTPFERQVIYENQFGRNTVTIDSVRYLLVPTQKLSPIPHPPPVGLDHYKAYRIKDPVAFSSMLILEDQFDRLYGQLEFINSLKPLYFLTPAIKNLEPGYDLLTHYVAYEIIPKRFFPLTAETFDQFGPHVLQTDSSWLLLVPTTKCRIEKICVPNWGDFNGQNAGPFQNTGTYNGALPVHVEIEQAIDISAGQKRLSAYVNGSHIDELNNNMGGLDGMDVLFGTTWVSPLYKGTLFSGTSQADLRGDYGDYPVLMPFTPLGPPVWDSFSVSGSAGPYNIEVLTASFAHADLPGLEYELHAFGVWVPVGGTEDCEYVIEDVYVISNAAHTDLVDLEKALFFDYDIGGNAALVDWDQQHASMWMYDAPAPDTTFGLTEVPAIKGVAPLTGWGISNPARIYDGQYLDSMKYYMEADPATGITGWGTDVPTGGDDLSILMADPKFTVPADGHHINKYIKWGYIGPIATGGDAAWRHFIYNVLHQFGYYRADVNKDGKFDVADVIYLVNYLFKGGPKPIEFVDQGDCNNDGNTNVTDVIFMVNNRFKGGPFPIDKERFYEAAPMISAPHKGLTIRESLFNDAAWKTLGQ